ncbi:hypothetical protein C289_0451 [Anoxybacillus ayderensis]|nr:hypothetical protein C289_0451 [Anoxybacillus ayderensis]
MVYYRLYNRFVENENNKLYAWFFSLFLNIIFALTLYKYDQNIVLKITPFILFSLHIVGALAEKGDMTKRFLDLIYTTSISTYIVACLNIICKIFSRDMMRFYILNIVAFLVLDVPLKLVLLYFLRIFSFLSFIPLLEYMFILKVTLQVYHILFIPIVYFLLNMNLFYISTGYFDAFIVFSAFLSLALHLFFVDRLLSVKYSNNNILDLNSKLYTFLYIIFIKWVSAPVTRTILILFLRDKKTFYEFVYMYLFLLSYALYLYKNNIYSMEFIVFYFIFLVHLFTYYEIKLRRKIRKVDLFVRFYHIDEHVIEKSFNYLALLFNLKFTAFFIIVFAFFVDFKWLIFIKILSYFFLFTGCLFLINVGQRRYISFLKYVCSCMIIGSLILNSF